MSNADNADNASLTLGRSNVENPSTVSVDFEEWLKFQDWQIVEKAKGTKTTDNQSGNKTTEIREDGQGSSTPNQGNGKASEAKQATIDNDLLKYLPLYEPYESIQREAISKLWQKHLRLGNSFWDFDSSEFVLRKIPSLPGFAPLVAAFNWEKPLRTATYEDQNPKLIDEQMLWGKLGYLACAAYVSFAESAEQTKQLIINADLKSEGSIEELLEKIKENNKKIVDRNHFWGLLEVCASKFNLLTLKRRNLTKPLHTKYGCSEHLLEKLVRIKPDLFKLFVDADVTEWIKERDEDKKKRDEEKEKVKK